MGVFGGRDSRGAEWLGMLKITYLRGTHLGCLGRKDQLRNRFNGSWQHEWVLSKQSSSTCTVKRQGPPGKRKQEKIKRSTFTRSRGTCQDINNSLEPLIFVTVSEMNDLLRVGWRSANLSSPVHCWQQAGHTQQSPHPCGQCQDPYAGVLWRFGISKGFGISWKFPVPCLLGVQGDPSSDQVWQ